MTDVFGLGQCVVDRLGFVDSYPQPDEKREFADMRVTLWETRPASQRIRSTLSPLEPFLFVDSDFFRMPARRIHLLCVHVAHPCARSGMIKADSFLPSEDGVQDSSLVGSPRINVHAQSGRIFGT